MVLPRQRLLPSLDELDEARISAQLSRFFRLTFLGESHLPGAFEWQFRYAGGAMEYSSDVLSRAR